jgi:uncharacterized protein
MSSFSDEKPQDEPHAESRSESQSEPRGEPQIEALAEPEPAAEPLSEIHSPRLEPPAAEFGPPEILAAPEFLPQDGRAADAPFAVAPGETFAGESAGFAPAQPEPPLTESPQIFSPMLPEVPRPVRIPHFGHLLMLLLILSISFSAAVGVIFLAVHNHLYGVTSIQGTATEIHYTLGSEALIYIFSLIGCFIVFPLFWRKSLFSGLQWNAATALRLRWRLVAAAFVCFLLALLNSEVLPGPKNTPIEEVFRQPGAAWLLFFFGITFAPFFEEMFFRGFLLPALATACDWIAEAISGVPVRPLAERGHPRWSLTAMIVASILTSLPFAGLHAAQTGYSLGPFLLLVGVSLVLCTVRLWTRSLAASTLVHASYNFMLFAIMLVGTQGFRHMDKL